jgi:hypothetical protein
MKIKLNETESKIYDLALRVISDQDYSSDVYTIVADYYPAANIVTRNIVIDVARAAFNGALSDQYSTEQPELIEVLSEAEEPEYNILVDPRWEDLL